MSNNVCPKCQSPNWDYACVGVPHAILCVDCGHIYNGKPLKPLDPLGSRWPFPTIDRPLTPLTPKEVKQYNKQLVQDLGDAMM